MKLDPNQYLKKLLNEEYAKRKKKNSRYSLRAFAKHAKCTPGTISELLQGKRKVSSVKAESILNEIKVHPYQVKKIKELFDTKNSIQALVPIKQESIELVLDEHTNHLISNWRYPAILALVKFDDFIYDTKWIAQKISIKQSEVEAIINELIGLGILELDKKNNKLTARRVTMRNSENVPKSVGDNVKKEALASGIEAVNNNVPGEYAYTSVGGYDPERLQEALPIIEDFVKRLSIYMSTGKRTDIFQLVVQVYPRSQVGK